jgi:hypothetical protein
MHKKLKINVTEKKTTIDSLPSMDEKIATLRYVLQAYIDAGRLMLFRHMEVGGGGKEEIIFLREYGEQIARIKTDYLPNLAALHCTHPWEGDYVCTHLVLEMVPPLPDLNCEHFIGERNIVVSGIHIHRYDIRVRDLNPLVPKAPYAYQMTPEYLVSQL